MFRVEISFHLTALNKWKITMFVAKLLSQIRSLIIIVNNNSLFFTLFNVHINIKKGNLQIIFTNLVLGNFTVLLLSLTFTVILCFQILFLWVNHILFIVIYILLNCVSHFHWIFHIIALYFYIIVPSLLNDVLPLLFYFPSLFHSH